MSALDLSRDTPEEFQGKTIVLGGREYVVGACWQETSQGHAHWLRNALSGQSLHILQIRREYLKSPTQARDASHTKARLSSQLRAASAEDGPVIAALMRAFDVCNGTVELHEWQMEGGQGEPALHLARQHAAAARWQDALQLVNQHLALQPFDSRAHALRGNLCVECGDFNAAHEAFSEAIEIEPNVSSYELDRLEAVVRSPSPIAALALYDDFKRRYPQAHDGDELAIHAYLRCGRSGQAHELLSAASLRKGARDALTPRVAAARSATAERQTLNAHWNGKDQRPEHLLSRLRAASQAYPDDPYLNVNLAFALMSSGDAEDAGQLLARSIGCLEPRYAALCMANAGYCAIRLGQWQRAEAYLSTAMRTLVSTHAGQVDESDAPGVAAWIDPEAGRIVEKAQPSAASILRPWMAEDGAEPRPSATVRELFALLERAEVALASAHMGGAPGTKSTQAQAGPPRPWWRSLFK